jgi:hypothetical protein
MLLDFYLLNATFFHGRMRPALADSWRRRSFAPSRELCQHLFSRSPEDALLRHVLRGLPFAREFWHGLVGELLLLGCEDMPLLQTAPATLCCLLAPERYREDDAVRLQFAPIEQVHYGSRDLRFGGAFYRPEHAGYNDEADVDRLVSYLDAVDPAAWRESQLRPMTEFSDAQEREDEIAFVRDWWPLLINLYRDAARRGCVVVCERW